LHAKAPGYPLGSEVVQIGEGHHLIYPRLPGQGEDRVSCSGDKPLALVARVQVPAHLHLAGGPVGHQQQRPGGLSRPCVRDERDDRPKAERSGPALLASLPAAEQISGFRTRSERPPGMRAEPAHHVLL
jgi:hypothetical protein